MKSTRTFHVSYSVPTHKKRKAYLDGFLKITEESSRILLTIKSSENRLVHSGNFKESILSIRTGFELNFNGYDLVVGDEMKGDCTKENVSTNIKYSNERVKSNPLIKQVVSTIILKVVSTNYFAL